MLYSFQTHFLEGPMEQLEQDPQDGIAFFETALGFALAVVLGLCTGWGLTTLVLSIGGQ
jgi:hypothetical protein